MVEKLELGLHRASVEALMGVNKNDPRRKEIERLASLASVPMPGIDRKALTETTPVEVKRFTDEAREALAREGYVINTLTGQSIASLREAGRKFWSSWHKDYPQFEALSSIQSEVAINPSQLFISESNNKTLAQQEEIINKFSQKLGKKVQGVDMIMGGVADYTDLAFAHLDQTGDYLFGEKDGYNYARTNTPTLGADVASVGDFRPVYGLNVGDWFHDYGTSNVFAAPLVVPKA